MRCSSGDSGAPHTIKNEPTMQNKKQRSSIIREEQHFGTACCYCMYTGLYIETSMMFSHFVE